MPMPRPINSTQLTHPSALMPALHNCMASMPSTPSNDPRTMCTRGWQPVNGPFPLFVAVPSGSPNATGRQAGERKREKTGIVCKQPQSAQKLTEVS
jgi:hypothetical protein